MTVLGRGCQRAIATTSGSSGSIGVGFAVPSDDAEAGLQAGDVVVRVGDRDVTDAGSLVVAVRSGGPGSSVEVHAVRGGQERTATVVLGEAPSSS